MKSVFRMLTFCTCEPALVKEIPGTKGFGRATNEGIFPLVLCLPAHFYLARDLFFFFFAGRALLWAQWK
jgi:hypothetical protein